MYVQEIGIRFPARVEIFLSSNPTDSRGSFSRVRQAGHEADHSPQFNVEVKIAAIRHRPHRYSWRGVNKVQKRTLCFYTYFAMVIETPVKKIKFVTKYLKILVNEKNGQGKHLAVRNWE